MWLNNTTTADGGDSFNGLTNTIYWNGKWTVYASNGNYNSPAICLMHELVHAYADKTEIGQRVFQNFCKVNEERLKGVQYDIPSEEFATTVEQSVAKQLGECSGRRWYNDLKWIPNDPKNPTCYFSFSIQVLSPLSYSKRN